MTRTIISTGWLVAGILVLAACPDPGLEPLPDLKAPLSDLSDLGPADLTPGTFSDAGEVARPSCDQPLGGPALPSNSTEGQPGFDELMAALDLAQLPPQLDLGAASDLNRAIVGYLLGKSATQLGTAVDRDAALAGGPLGKVVVSAFAFADPLGKKGADLTFMRRGLYRYYHCVRGYPLTLDGFRRVVWDYQTVAGQIIDSVPKAGPRRLFVNSAIGVYVAETLVNGAVRETEIQVAKVRPDGSHDFLTYDNLGQQIRTSSFASGGGNMRVASSPYTCMACHFDKASKSFSAVVPN